MHLPGGIQPAPPHIRASHVLEPLGIRPRLTVNDRNVQRLVGLLPVSPHTNHKYPVGRDIIRWIYDQSSTQLAVFFVRPAIQRVPASVRPIVIGTRLACLKRDLPRLSRRNFQNIVDLAGPGMHAVHYKGDSQAIMNLRVNCRAFTNANQRSRNTRRLSSLGQRIDL